VLISNLCILVFFPCVSAPPHLGCEESLQENEDGGLEAKLICIIGVISCNQLICLYFVEVCLFKKFLMNNNARYPFEIREMYG